MDQDNPDPSQIIVQLHDLAKKIYPKDTDSEGKDTTLLKSILSEAKELNQIDPLVGYACLQEALKEAQGLSSPEKDKLTKDLKSLIQISKVSCDPTKLEELFGKFYQKHYKENFGRHVLIQEKGKKINHEIQASGDSSENKNPFRTEEVLFRVLKNIGKNKVSGPASTNLVIRENESNKQSDKKAPILEVKLIEEMHDNVKQLAFQNEFEKSIIMECYKEALEKAFKEAHRLSSSEENDRTNALTRHRNEMIAAKGETYLVEALEKFYDEHFEENIRYHVLTLDLNGENEQESQARGDSQEIKNACKTAEVLYRVLASLWNEDARKRNESQIREMIYIRKTHATVEQILREAPFQRLLEIWGIDPPEIPDSEMVPSSIAEISPILRVANELHPEKPHIFNICIYAALRKAKGIDPNALGDGVRPFMTSLFNWLQKDDTKVGKRHCCPTDIPPMEKFYLDYCIKVSTNTSEDPATGPDPVHRNACQTAGELYKVLEIIWKDDDMPPMNHMTLPDQKEECDEANRIMEEQDLSASYKVYNILPLGENSKDIPIRKLDEIKVALTALSETEGLPSPGDGDILDWLKTMYGFQEDNVSNQREHLVLLLANFQRQRQDGQNLEDLDICVVDGVMKKLLGNYRKWCKYLRFPNNYRFHEGKNIDQMNIGVPTKQRKLLYIALYLLIWGEAANLRLMPECLCYIYHNMALELNNTLINGDLPAYGGEKEAFLNKVVTPIYTTLAKEAKGGGEGEHSKSRNYDDLNEYFWAVSTSRDLKQWLDHPNFYSKEIEQDKLEHKTSAQDDKRKQIMAGTSSDASGGTLSDATPGTSSPPAATLTTQSDGTSSDATAGTSSIASAGDGCVSKVNFSESRSFLHLLRSFDRMWRFYILGLQVMIIIAWNQSTQLGAIFRGESFHNTLSIFITAAALEFVQAMLEIYLSLNARHNKPRGSAIYIIMKISCFFIPAVFLVIQPYYIPAVFLLIKFPLVKLVMWLNKPLLYIGKGMDENTRSHLKYRIFWIFLLSLKFAFSYVVEIRPLVGPTKEIMRLHLSEYHFSELFSHVKYIFLVITLWAPVISIYFMDTQIWYAALSTLVGGYTGISRRLGEVQTLGMLRTRFKLLPRELIKNLVPQQRDVHEIEQKEQHDKKESETKEAPAKFETKDEEIKEVEEKKLPMDETKEAPTKDETKEAEQKELDPRFCQMWNTIITSLRQEDLINDGEKDLMMMPYWKKLDAKNKKDSNEFPRWPLFLLTNKIHMVLDIAKDSKGNESKLSEAWDADFYMRSAVFECYTSFKILLSTLANTAEDNKILNEIFSEIDQLAKGTKEKLIGLVDWSNLPNLFKQFFQLIEHLRKPYVSPYNVRRILRHAVQVVESGMMKNLLPALRFDEKCFKDCVFRLEDHIEDWTQNISRLHLLLTYKDPAIDVPSNLEAQRRLTYFSNSLLMEMPDAPKMRNMLSFSALTPYYTEDVIYSNSNLIQPNEDGISILSYLKTIFPDEWTNFLERFKRDTYKDRRGRENHDEIEKGQRRKILEAFKEDPRAKAILEDIKNRSKREGTLGESDDDLEIKVKLDEIKKYPTGRTILKEIEKYGRAIREEIGKDGRAILEEIGKDPRGRAILEEIEKDPEIREKLEGELRLWASYRGQTLARTVRGMTYYRKALKIQAFFDITDTDVNFHAQEINEVSEELMKGCYPWESTRIPSEIKSPLLDHCQALADMKFTYVVSCQRYGIYKRSGDQRAKDILRLMTMYPYLRVAYIDEVEQILENKREVEKVYYSVLVKAAPLEQGKRPLDEVIYKIKLPGNPMIGEGKPENQNHAIIFTRGQALQTIDMNQDNYMEEAFKMRNLLQEFSRDVGENDHDEKQDENKQQNGSSTTQSNRIDRAKKALTGVWEHIVNACLFRKSSKKSEKDPAEEEDENPRQTDSSASGSKHDENSQQAGQASSSASGNIQDKKHDENSQQAGSSATHSNRREKGPTILGLREHIFTGSVSSLAWFMSNQEKSFVTLGQRVLASPLKVRFHYGHPDVFDRLFHLTRGGVSKASKTINLSEDIFAGFNSILRKGNITHHEYMQVGKGRDLGLNQISMFEAKIANGSGEQTISRDVYRLGQTFDFFRMLSFYFTTVGFYYCSMLTVLAVYLYLYGRVYLALTGLEKELLNNPAIRDTKALQAALASQSMVQMGFLMAFPMIMVIGTENGFHNALFDFVVMQLQLAPVFYTFQLGIKAHYYCKTLLHGGAKYMATGRGFVVVHAKFAENYRMYSNSHFVKAFELMILLLLYHMFGNPYMGAVTHFLVTFSLWSLVGSWLFAPFIFNPSGFEWHKIVDDWKDWKKWIYDYDIGELALHPESSWVSWWEKEQQYIQQSGFWGMAIETGLASRFLILHYRLVYQLSSFEDNQRFWVYVGSWVLLLVVIYIMNVPHSLGKVDPDSTKSQFCFRISKVIFIIVMAILVSIIAFRLLTLKDIFVCMLAFISHGWGVLLIAQWWGYGSKTTMRNLAWGYDLLMGFVLFLPIGFLAWFPFVSELQTKLLFNQAFSRSLKMSHILGVRSSEENKE